MYISKMQPKDVFVAKAHLCSRGGQGGGDFDVALGLLASPATLPAALADLGRAAIQRAHIAQQRPRYVQRRLLRAGSTCQSTLTVSGMPPSIMLPDFRFARLSTGITSVSLAQQRAHSVELEVCR